MKKNRRSISIKKSIIIGFILTMLLSIGSIGYMVFTNWYSSASRTTESIAEDLNERIYNQLYSFMHVPEHINEVNFRIIDNGILELSDESLRDKFFVGVLDSHDKEIYSFSYGTVDGEYYGASRNEEGVIEIVRSNSETGGNLWSYRVDDEMTAGDVVAQLGKFDPRTRAWFKAAVRFGRPAFSPLYKHFVMDDLTISHASPVYNKNGELQGVLGTHMLLTDLGEYLSDAVNKYNGYAVLVEKESDTLIANSMNIDNYIVLSDGTLERQNIDKIENPSIKTAYEKYMKHRDSDVSYNGKINNLYINVREINYEGLDWIIISAIPEEILITPVIKTLYLTVLLTVLTLLIAIVIYMIIAGRLLRPMNSLLKVTEALSAGDLTKRVPIVRNDEIGRISSIFNNVADKMQFLISDLESAVEERTKELYKLNHDLEENKDKLQLLLDSTAEAIYGIDMNGRCTFCNKSAIKLLGYNSQEALLGKNMHSQIHHSRRDGKQFNIEDCRILQSIKQGKGFEADDEVFWRADGTSFDVEYHSYPQIRDGEVVGGVVTFMDITERKQREAKIQYLSNHDILTGLQNRRSFEENRIKMDIPEHLPLSVIFADINGLKMTNDIFGHSEGDKLIKETANILVRSCRENDIVARVGGDEFIILMPNTDSKNAEKIIKKIKTEFINANEHMTAIKCSISLGFDTKSNPEESLDEIMNNAENAMYKDKAINKKSMNTDMAGAIIDALHLRSSYEKRHSIEVSKLCGEIGAYMNLSELEINRLKRAGYLHDIGKITFNDRLLSLQEYTEEEYLEMNQHAIVGYRILNLFDDTLDLAEHIYSHHENWDGNGYPRGLKGIQISLIARIVAIAENYERELNRGSAPLAERKKKALLKIKEGSGKRFDPEIVKLFIQMIEEKEANRRKS